MFDTPDADPTSRSSTLAVAAEDDEVDRVVDVAGDAPFDHSDDPAVDEVVAGPAQIGGGRVALDTLARGDRPRLAAAERRPQAPDPAPGQGGGAGGRWGVRPRGPPLAGRAGREVWPATRPRGPPEPRRVTSSPSPSRAWACVMPWADR